MTGSNGHDEWLRQARLIDALVREEMRRRGHTVNPKSFNEMLASGELHAAECRLRSITIFDPMWLLRTVRDDEDDH